MQCMVLTGHIVTVDHMGHYMIWSCEREWKKNVCRHYSTTSQGTQKSIQNIYIYIYIKWFECPMCDRRGFRVQGPYITFRMDISWLHTTTMSNIPTPSLALRGPKEAFATILNAIITATPAQRLANIQPHLLTFLSHPIIKELASQCEPPAQAQSTTSNNLEL